jgi:hypothetical protein
MLSSRPCSRITTLIVAFSQSLRGSRRLAFTPYRARLLRTATGDDHADTTGPPRENGNRRTYQRRKWP